MYSGFGRLTIVAERKKSFLFVAHAQEVFLHYVPLTWLVIENSRDKAVEFETLAKFICLVTIVSLVLVFAEILVL